MSLKRSYKQCSKEFKNETVALVLEQDYSVKNYQDSYDNESKK
jgi:transposase-like protein